VLTADPKFIIDTS